MVRAGRRYETLRATRNQSGRSRVSGGVVTQMQQELARRPVLDLVCRVLVIVLLALVIFVGFPLLASAGS